jgi:hypothetical protein
MHYFEPLFNWPSFSLFEVWHTAPCVGKQLTIIFIYVPYSHGFRESKKTEDAKISG